MTTELMRIKNYKKLKEHRDKKQLMGSSFAGISGYRLCAMCYKKYAPVMVARRVA